MGLFGKLFGKNNNAQGDAQKARVIDAVRSATGESMTCDGCYSKIENALPSDASFALKVDVVNALFEMDRDDYAEALAKRLANDPACPLGFAKGLTRHFFETGQTELVVAPLERVVAERPGDLDFAVALGRELLRQKEYSRVLEKMDAPMLQTQDRHLFAIVGEAQVAQDQHEDALNSLRVAAEFYQEAFQLQRVLPDDMNQEQLEYQRVFSLLEETAQKVGGDEAVEEAFQNIQLQPTSFGLVKEADNLAAQHTEYKPLIADLWPTDKLAERAATLETEVESEEDPHAPRIRLLKAEVALREHNYAEALSLFRQVLEFDLQAFGAYYGWAACDALQRLEPLADVEVLTDSNIEKLCPCWSAFTEHEKKIASLALKPISTWISALIEKEYQATVHPLDVRVSNLHAKRDEMRFDAKDRSPFAQTILASKQVAHTRLDEFLMVRPGQFGFARSLGFLLSSYAKADGKMASKCEGMKKKAGASSLDELFCNATEALACVETFGDEAKGEVYEAAQQSGILDLIASGPK